MVVVIQAVYPQLGYLPLVSEFFARHSAYCDRFGIEYQFLLGRTLDIDPKEGGWDKLVLIQEALERHDLVMWLDADAFIEDMETDIRSVPLPENSIGVIHFPNPPHWNVGVMYFRKGLGVWNFLNDWLAMKPYPEHRWREQMAFQVLAGKHPELITTLPAEWNCSVDHNWQRKRIVSATHGIVGAQRRLEVMREIRDGNKR